MWPKKSRFGTPIFIMNPRFGGTYPIVLVGETEQGEESLSWGYTHLGRLMAFRRIRDGFEEVSEALYKPQYEEAVETFSKCHTAFLAGAVMWENAREYRSDIMTLQRYNSG